MPPGLPGVDIELLANVVRRLSERRLHAYTPGSRRAAVALILRFDDDTQRTLTRALRAFRDVTRHLKSSLDVAADGGMMLESVALARRISPDAFVQFLESQQQRYIDAEAASALQLLFLRRDDVDDSRWSGQVTFPGGRRDPEEDTDDFQTVCRATYEELGLPLQHHGDFLCLGRLPDHQLYSRAATATTGGVVQARFVFLHVGDMTPSVQFAAHVVESARWVPLHRLASLRVEPGGVVQPLTRFVHPRDTDARLLLRELFPSTYLTFPSVSLTTIAPDQATSTADTKDTQEAGKHDRQHSVPAWRVWGMTLRSTSELLAFANRPPADWPLVASNSRVLQYGVFFPFHGYYEAVYQLYRGRAWLAAQLRSSAYPPVAFLAEKLKVGDLHRLVLFGSVMDRRDAILPLGASSLFYAVPETPQLPHVACFGVWLVFLLWLLYSVALLAATVAASARSRERRADVVERRVEGRTGEMGEMEEASAVAAAGITVANAKATSDRSVSHVDKPVAHRGDTTTALRSSFSPAQATRVEDPQGKGAAGRRADEAALAAALGSVAPFTTTPTEKEEPAAANMKAKTAVAVLPTVSAIAVVASRPADPSDRIAAVAPAVTPAPPQQTEATPLSHKEELAAIMRRYR